MTMVMLLYCSVLYCTSMLRGPITTIMPQVIFRSVQILPNFFDSSILSVSKILARFKPCLKWLFSISQAKDAIRVGLWTPGKVCTWSLYNKYHTDCASSPRSQFQRHLLWNKMGRVSRFGTDPLPTVRPSYPQLHPMLTLSASQKTSLLHVHIPSLLCVSEDQNTSPTLAKLLQG
jgi:hypothetical protein